MGVLNYHVVYKEIYSTHRQTDTHFGVVHNNKGLMGQVWQVNKISSKTLIYSITDPCMYFWRTFSN